MFTRSLPCDLSQPLDRGFERPSVVAGEFDPRLSGVSVRVASDTHAELVRDRPQMAGERPLGFRRVQRPRRDLAPERVTLTSESLRITPVGRPDESTALTTLTLAAERQEGVAHGRTMRRTRRRRPYERGRGVRVAR